MWVFFSKINSGELIVGFPNMEIKSEKMTFVGITYIIVGLSHFLFLFGTVSL